MGDILMQLLRMRRQGAAPQGQGSPMMPPQPPSTPPFDPQMLQANAVPPPQGQDNLTPMLQFLQQHSGVLNMLRNRRNQSMNAVQDLSQY